MSLSSRDPLATSPPNPLSVDGEGERGGEVRPAHGGLDLRELEALGIPPDEVLDFSASINPLGPPPNVLRALASLDVASYPDPECRALRRALSRRLGLSAEWTLVGNGSVELIHLLARAFLKPRDRGVVFAPTFGEYQAACHLAGAELVLLQARAEDGFRWEVDGALTVLREAKPRLVFLCNPNNPTGVYLAQRDVERIVTALPDAIVAVDEAYAVFADEPWDSLPLLRHPNVVLLHSMTKAYAIPALRLGYALARAEVLRPMARLQPAWSVNGAALAAGLAALQEDAYLQIARACVQESKAYLRKRLEAEGVRVVPGGANFLLVEVGDARSARQRLLTRRLCVRDCTSFGLPQYIRIGVRTLAECARLADALLRVVADG